MPVSSGYGKWPTEYGVGIQEERIKRKCALCTQKGCFDCEHLTPVKNSIFQHEPYLKPNEKFSLADRHGTIAKYLKDNSDEHNDKNSQNHQGSGTSRSNTSSHAKAQNGHNDSKNSKKSTDPKAQHQKSTKENGQKTAPNNTNNTNTQKPEKKSTCSIL